MRNLNDTLDEIAAIRDQIARTAEFRGLGPLTVAMTGFLALAAAEFQSLVMPGAARDAGQFLLIWVSTGVVAIALIGAEMVARTRIIHSGLAQEMIVNAVEELVPSGVAGLLLTVVLYRLAPDGMWMIPGLWQILLSLGACASARFLPRSILLVAGWYLMAGLICLSWASTHRILSPWTMGLPFAVGQLLAAMVLQRSSSSFEKETDER